MNKKMGFILLACSVFLVMSVPAVYAKKAHPVHEKRRAFKEKRKEAYKGVNDANQKERQELMKQQKVEREKLKAENKEERKTLRNELDTNEDGIISDQERAAGKDAIKSLRQENKTERKELSNQQKGERRSLAKEQKEERQQQGSADKTEK